jgi:hypothetical protein
MTLGTDELCDERRVTAGGRVWVCNKERHNTDNHSFVIDYPHLPEPTVEATPELESSLESFFRKRVKLLGGEAIKLAPHQAGIPDRLVIMPGGHMFLVELKTDTGQLSPIQVVWHQRMEKLGVAVHTVNGRAGVVDFLRRITEALGTQKRRRRTPVQ